MLTKSTFPCFIALFLLLSCNPPLSKRHILVIGDDHAADRNGWVFHFQQERKGGPLVNTAVKGATTAFPNPRQPQTNTLDQLVPHLRRGFAEMGAIDEVIVQLGTNDCKAEYQAGSVEQQVNYRKLIQGIRDFFEQRGQDIPRMTLVTPPPIADKPDPDFAGGAECVRMIAESLKVYAEKEGLCFVDLSQNEDLAALVNIDGHNYSATGNAMMARSILKSCY